MKRREFYIKLFFRLFDELPYGIMDTVAELTQEAQKELFETWLFVACDIQKSKASSEIINSDFREQIDIYKPISSDALIALIRLLRDAIYSLSKNANVKILIEYLAAYCKALKVSFI